MTTVSPNIASDHSWQNELRCLFLLIFCCTLLNTDSWGQKREVPVDSLVYDLKNPDPVRRRKAAEVLGKNKIRRATPDLVAAANDPNRTVRREIVIALDHMLDMRSIPAFVSLMGDPEKAIRERCIRGVLNLYLPKETGLVVGLTKVGNFLNPWSDELFDVVVEPGIIVDPSVITALRDRLQDSKEGVRVDAARALGVLRGRAAIPAMVESLRQDRSNSVKLELVRSLHKIGDTTVSDELMSYLGYNQSKIRNQIVFTLGRFRYKPAVPELTRLYEKESSIPSKKRDKTHRELLFDALAFIADPSSQDLFFKEKQNPDDTFRLHAVEGLARIGDPTLVTEISHDRLREKDSKLKVAQAYAIYRMGREEYLEEVVNGLDSGKTRNEAMQYLVELNQDELENLYPYIHIKKVEVRESLAEIFGLVGDSHAIPSLQELSKDNRGKIATLATQAIRRINARINQP